MEGVEFTEFTTTLAPADICVIYTDGISEAMNAEHQLFGEERIGQVVSEHRTDRPEQMLKTIMDAVLAYRGETPQSDDITMVAFTRTE
jgi:sigma-B regulation protein RsbU (phosphoserine phosphatase)